MRNAWRGPPRLDRARCSTFNRTVLCVAAAVVLAALLLTGLASRLGRGAPAAALTVPTGDPGAWPVYHHDPAGTGVASGAASVDTAAPTWTSAALGGQLYGEPLVASGRVLVATEGDTVTALSTRNGAELWSVQLGTPVPASDLPCGNIAPTVGITGTPVLDQARRELFAVVDVLVHGSAAHELVGLDVTDGAVELRQPVDPTGASHEALLQRTALTIDAGRVVFGFGGNYGDCGSYRGWVVSVPETGGTPLDFAVDGGAGEHQGAIWMGGGAPAVDASGNLWVTSGNGSVTSSAHAYDDSDGVLELSPALALRQYFAPSSWSRENAADLDLSTEPALLPGGQVVAAGKSRTAYLLDGAALGGVGGEQASLATGCADDVDGGTAAVGTIVYLPCLAGTIAVSVTGSPPGLRIMWRTSAGGGPPIVAAGLVWTQGQDGSLTGLDPATGAVRQRTVVAPPVDHFPTPSTGDGLLLVATADRVVAFAAPPTPSGATTTSTTTPPHHRPTVVVIASAGPSPLVLGLAAGAAALVALLAWVTVRVVRRRR